MARRRRKKGSGGGGGGGIDDSVLAESVQGFKDLMDRVKDVKDSLGDFAKSALEHSSEVTRARGALQEIASQSVLPGLQGLGGALSPVLGGLVGGIRGGLGNVAAMGTAANQLEDLAAGAAFSGMPLSKETLQAINPFLQARAKGVERARALAHDVTGDSVGNAFAESGIGQKLVDVFQKGFESMDQLREAIREVRNGHPFDAPSLNPR
jgi:hypothetical protein